MKFLTKDNLMDLHAAIIKPDQPKDIRDEMVLDKIIEDAQNRDIKTVFEQAAVYLAEIAKFQPFTDGNRRESFGAAVIFLRMNGYKFKPKKLSKLMDTMTEIKEDKIILEEIKDWIRKRSVPKTAKNFKDSLKWFLEKYGPEIDNLATLPDAYSK